jgi:hypothetical protein
MAMFDLQHSLLVHLTLRDFPTVAAIAQRRPVFPAFPKMNDRCDWCGNEQNCHRPDDFPPGPS